MSRIIKPQIIYNSGESSIILDKDYGGIIFRGRSFLDGDVILKTIKSLTTFNSEFNEYTNQLSIKSASAISIIEIHISFIEKNNFISKYKVRDGDFDFIVDSAFDPEYLIWIASPMPNLIHNVIYDVDGDFISFISSDLGDKMADAPDYDESNNEYLVYLIRFDRVYYSTNFNESIYTLTDTIFEKSEHKIIQHNPTSGEVLVIDQISGKLIPEIDTDYKTTITTTPKPENLFENSIVVLPKITGLSVNTSIPDISNTDIFSKNSSEHIFSNNMSSDKIYIGQNDQQKWYDDFTKLVSSKKIIDGSKIVMFSIDGKILYDLNNLFGNESKAYTLIKMINDGTANYEGIIIKKDGNGLLINGNQYNLSTYTPIENKIWNLLWHGGKYDASVIFKDPSWTTDWTTSNGKAKTDFQKRASGQFNTGFMIYNSINSNTSSKYKLEFVLSNNTAIFIDSNKILHTMICQEATPDEAEYTNVGTPTTSYLVHKDMMATVTIDKSIYYVPSNTTLAIYSFDEGAFDGYLSINKSQATISSPIVNMPKPEMDNMLTFLDKPNHLLSFNRFILDSLHAREDGETLISIPDLDRTIQFHKEINLKPITISNFILEKLATLLKEQTNGERIFTYEFNVPYLKLPDPNSSSIDYIISDILRFGKTQLINTKIPMLEIKIGTTIRTIKIKQTYTIIKNLETNIEEEKILDTFIIEDNTEDFELNYNKYLNQSKQFDYYKSFWYKLILEDNNNNGLMDINIKFLNWN